MPIIPITPNATTALKGKVKLANHLGGTADLPTVIGVQEVGGTSMIVGAVGDGEFLKRSGSTLVSAAVPSNAASFATIQLLASMSL